MSFFKFLLTSVCLINQVDGFQFARPTLHLETRTRLHSFSYGRGADIWPPTNEDAVHLRDTFPNGQVPYSAIVTIEQQDMEAVHEGVEEAINGTMTQNDTPKRSKRKFVSRSIRRILRRAAAKEELDSEGEIVGVDRTPIIVALTLLMQGLVRPMDGIVVGCITFYLTFLGVIARSPRENSEAPILPAMPPQGHVPVMVSNPLGMGILYSRLYDAWLKLGVIIGLVGPMLLLTRYILFENNVMAARVCSRPTFLLCCQAISESFSRKVMAPLPLRIFVPVLYNTARLGYLWNWASQSMSLGLVGRSLAILNAIYWTANLFAFLIPVATIRYMRAHFFGVEAAEVTTRIGMEESVGLIPNQ